MGKIHQERGFAIASRSGDKNQLAVYVLVDKIYQTLTMQKAGLLSGKKDLGDHDRGCLWHFGLPAGDLKEEKCSQRAMSSCENNGQKSDNWVPSILISSPPATLWAHRVVSGSR